MDGVRFEVVEQFVYLGELTRTDTDLSNESLLQRDASMDYV